MDDIELTRTLADHDNEIKGLKRRMKDVEDVTKEIHHIATSVELLAVEAKNTGDKVDKLSDKVESIEKKPAEKAEKMKDAVIADCIKIVIGALLGGLLALILK